jgi:hypothetical protein
LLEPTEQSRECHLAFTLDSHVGLQVPKRRLGKNAVPGATQDYGCGGKAATSSHPFPQRRQQEAGVLHVLVIDVPNRNADNVRTQLANRICDSKFPVAARRKRQQLHVMTSSLRSRSDASETNRQRSSEFSRFVHNGDEQHPHLLASSASRPDSNSDSKR